MTKKWWVEVGGYDDGMMEWGGENIEQSLRCWMCGGEIVVERSSQVGHIFFRPAVANKVKPLSVPRNKARGGYVWLDDYYGFFQDNLPQSKELDLGNFLLERMLFRYTYGCKKFDWWLHRFQNVFEEQGLIVDRQHHIRHSATGLCLEGTQNLRVKMAVCDPVILLQKWGFINSRRRLVNGSMGKCLDEGNHPDAHSPILYNCDRTMSNRNQVWRFTNGADPPHQKDRNFHDQKVFGGKLVNPDVGGAADHAAAPSGEDADGKNAENFQVVSGRCLLFRYTAKAIMGKTTSLVEMTKCDAATATKPEMQWDVIW